MFFTCRVQVLGIVVVALIWINGLSTMEEIPDIYVDGEEETIDHPMPDVAKNTYIVASLDSHLWVLLFLFLLIKCSIIGLLLKYLLQTLESVRMTEPQLQHCWVDFRGCWWKQFLIHMSFFFPRILCSGILMTSYLMELGTDVSLFFGTWCPYFADIWINLYICAYEQVFYPFEDHSSVTISCLTYLQILCE